MALLRRFAPLLLLPLACSRIPAPAPDPAGRAARRRREAEAPPEERGRRAPAARAAPRQLRIDGRQRRNAGGLRGRAVRRARGAGGARGRRGKRCHRRHRRRRQHPGSEHRQRTAEDRGLHREHHPRRLCDQRHVLHAVDAHHGREAVRAHAVSGDDRGRPDDGHHGEGSGARRHDDRRRDVSGSVGADHPGREGCRRTDAHGGHHQRRADHQRAPGVAAPERRVAVRPGPAPARPAGHQGHRPRSAPVQHRGVHPVPGLEPGIRRPVGQHVLLAVR